MKRLFLFARANLLVIIFNPTVVAGLFSVVPLQSVIKKLMINVLDIFVAVIYVLTGALTVNIRSLKLARIVIDRAFADLRTRGFVCATTETVVFVEDGRAATKPAFVCANRPFHSPPYK